MWRNASYRLEDLSTEKPFYNSLRYRNRTIAKPLEIKSWKNAETAERQRKLLTTICYFRYHNLQLMVPIKLPLYRIQLPVLDQLPS